MEKIEKRQTRGQRNGEKRVRRGGEDIPTGFKGGCGSLDLVNIKGFWIL